MIRLCIRELLQNLPYPILLRHLLLQLLADPLERLGLNPMRLRQ